MKFSAKLAVAILFTVASVFSQGKFGYVDSDQVVLQSKEAQSIQVQLQQLSMTAEKELAAKQGQMQQEIQILQQQAESQGNLLSDEAKMEIVTKMKTLEKEYYEFGQAKQYELMKKEQELSAPISKKVTAIIAEIAEAENFDMIFDTKAGLLYGKPGFDLTQKVITKLNAGK